MRDQPSLPAPAANLPAEIRVIAHRGASAYAPENTLASLREAHRRGCRWVEFDVKLSSDGVAVLGHDETLERTTSGRGKLRDKSVRELEELDAGSWFDERFAREPLPSLAKVMELLGELGLAANVEIKPCQGRERETGERVAREIREGWSRNLPLPLLSSFSEEALAAAAETLPEAPRGLVRRHPGAEWLDTVRRLGCSSLHVWHGALTRALVRRAKEAGLLILVFTVNDPVRARRLFDQGVDAVFSDCPDRIQQAFPGTQ